MTDPATAARSARENLARGLAVLQAPGIPPQIMDVAEPVAQAMGALHRIESSGGAATRDQAPIALDAVRRALAMLQSAAGQHPAVDQATEAVAGSLGLVHSLSQAAAAPPAPAAAPSAPPPQQAALPAQQPPAAFAATAVIPPTAPAAPAALQQYASQQGYPAQQPFAPPAAPAQQMPPAYAPPATPAAAPGYGPPPAAPNPAPWNQPAAAPQPPPASWPHHAQPQPGSAPQHAAPPQPAGAAVPMIAAPADVPRVEANLGAHSPSNFYKGLSGNDVIDSGGIFIATYKIPKIGTNLVVKVSLPGGYEFEALGTVEWVREAPNSTAGVEAPPGFGAKLTQITPEGRQLVYRYVRNREPLFHDDL
jgi:hypothetical protein